MRKFLCFLIISHLWLVAIDNRSIFWTTCGSFFFLFYIFFCSILMNRFADLILPICFDETLLETVPDFSYDEIASALMTQTNRILESFYEQQGWSLEEFCFWMKVNSCWMSLTSQIRFFFLFFPFILLYISFLFGLA